jgi:hypothetical protein
MVFTQIWYAEFTLQWRNYPIWRYACNTVILIEYIYPVAELSYVAPACPGTLLYRSSLTREPYFISLLPARRNPTLYCSSLLRNLTLDRSCLPYSYHFCMPRNPTLYLLRNPTSIASCLHRSLIHITPARQGTLLYIAPAHSGTLLLSLLPAEEPYSYSLCIPRSHTLYRSCLFRNPTSIAPACTGALLI